MSSDQDNLARRKIYEQCVLMHFVGAETRQAEEPADTGLASLNASCKYTSFIPIKGPPTEMMSTLTGRTDLNSLMNLTPYQLSFLVPKVRLYKSYVGRESQPGSGGPNLGGKHWDVEMLFADNISGIIAGDNQDKSNNRLKRMLESRAGRGTGVGIKGFSWQYRGTNPAEAANLLTANLSLQFSDIQELFEKRGPFTATLNPVTDPKNIEYNEKCYFQYVDLIMRTAETGVPATLPEALRDNDSENWCKWMWLYNPEHFELKAVVGWELKEGAPFSPEQIQNLRSASTILYLTIVDHVIAYNEDGTMNLDISYRAAIESILDDPNTDLFISVFERTRQAQIEAMRRALTSGKSQTVTSNGSIQGETDSYGTSQPNNQQTGADETNNRDKDLAEALQQHHDEMRSLTRGMGYLTLQQWISDETHIPSFQIGLETAGWEGRKLETDTSDYDQDTDASPGSYKSNNATSEHYGAPWPLSYGPVHGGKFDKNQGPNGMYTDGGLMRIKQIFVPPEYVGVVEEAQEEGEEKGTAFKLGFPAWATMPESFPTSRLTNSLSSDTASGLPGGARGRSPTGGDGGINSQAASAINDNASPNAIGSGDSGGGYSKILENMVNSNLFHKHQATGTYDEDLETALNGATYPIQFIYYGDLIDWAIRKALWRPPYTPDSAYVALDKFAEMAETLAGTSANYASWASINALEEWDRANAGKPQSEAVEPGDKGVRGPDGKTISITKHVDDLEAMKERKFDKINIILGSIEYFDVVTKTSVHINLADIPISLNRWNEWFVNKIQRPGVYSYSLRRFIKETLNSLVLDIFEGRGCYNNPKFAKQIFDIGISNFTLPAFWDGEKYVNPAAFITKPEFYINADADADDQNYRIDLTKIQATLDKQSLFEVHEDNTDVYHFIAIYARGYESSTLLGLETDEEAKAATEPGGWLASNELYNGAKLPGDLSRGIFHFYLGHNQGLVKSIKFTRTDQKYLAESRLLGQGAFGYNQLRGRYEATIIMQGNTFFLPGQFIYINPNSVGSGDAGTDYEDTALLLGLGGYYNVLDIECIITPEFFETHLKCVWHGSGRPEICNKTSDDVDNSGALGATFTQVDAQTFASRITAAPDRQRAGPDTQSQEYKETK